MIKKILAVSLFIFNSTTFACPDALPTDDVNFCPSFKAAAVCYCTSSGLPAGLCQDMKTLYNRMIAMFGSLEKACAYQKNTSAQMCIDDWNCYLHGGVDSQGRSCSSTQRACE